MDSRQKMTRFLPLNDTKQGAHFITIIYFSLLNSSCFELDYLFYIFCKMKWQKRHTFITQKCFVSVTKLYLFYQRHCQEASDLHLSIRTYGILLNAAKADGRYGLAEPMLPGLVATIGTILEQDQRKLVKIFTLLNVFDFHLTSLLTIRQFSNFQSKLLIFCCKIFLLWLGTVLVTV